MASYLSWSANAALILTGCFVTANMANGVIGEWISPSLVEASDTQLPNDPGASLSRAPAAIIHRNLFQSTLQAPQDGEASTPSDDEGPLEQSELPLRLLGTVASDDPTIARAALEDTELRERLVVRIGDRIKETATVYRIERRRVVLAENDGMRELSLDDEPGVAAAVTPAKRRRAALAKRRRAKPKVTREDIKETLREPSNLFRQARFLPKYEDGKMEGYQVNGIKPGSLVEKMGLADGDIIVKANGVAIDNPSAGQFFRQINEIEELTLNVLRPDGSTEEIRMPIDE